jgi:predicted RNA-binding protein YlqC (UPF0109 family)
MIELVAQMAKAIVDRPDQVRVHGVEGEHSMVIELRVAPEDTGKIIGKRGRTITAMRTILNATRAQKGKRHVLEVLDYSRPQRGLQMGPRQGAGLLLSWVGRLGALQRWGRGDVQFPMSCGAKTQGNAQISLDMNAYYGA